MILRPLLFLILMIKHFFHNYRAASLIVYSSFDFAVVDPVDSVREFASAYSFRSLTETCFSKSQ
jgi:tRNA nucleotidyltransferase (CCA-adding enzyme)